MVGKPQLCDDPRFNSIAARSVNIVALYELAGACFVAKPTDEWLTLLRKLEIPSARMSTLDEVMADPQLEAGGFFKRATHPSEGEILYTDMPCALAVAQQQASGCSRGSASTVAKSCAKPG
jgi:formyl-CoA transferase